MFKLKEFPIQVNRAIGRYLDDLVPDTEMGPRGMNTLRAHIIHDISVLAAEKPVTSSFTTSQIASELRGIAKLRRHYGYARLASELEGIAETLEGIAKHVRPEMWSLKSKSKKKK